MLGQEGLTLGIQLLVMAVFGLICSGVASSRGRSPVGWFFIGVLAPCLGLILVLVLPDLKIAAEREQRFVRQNRRLRETALKDRMVADRRHSSTERRLGVHDVALGVDTSASPSEIAAGGGEPPPLPEDTAPTQSIRAATWHYATGGQRNGPIGFETLRDLWHDSVLTEDSLVWTPGMEEWIPIADVPFLTEVLDE